jgi:hypothetical protein
MVREWYFPRAFRCVESHRAMQLSESQISKCIAASEAHRIATFRMTPACAITLRQRHLQRQHVAAM